MKLRMGKRGAVVYVRKRAAALALAVSAVAAMLVGLYTPLLLNPAPMHRIMAWANTLY